MLFENADAILGLEELGKQQLLRDAAMGHAEAEKRDQATVGNSITRNV